MAPFFFLENSNRFMGNTRYTFRQRRDHNYDVIVSLNGTEASYFVTDELNHTGITVRQMYNTLFAAGYR